MIEIKPKQWRNLPALVGWLELETSMCGEETPRIKVLKSESFPHMLKAAPLHLPLMEVLFTKFYNNLVYTFNQAEWRAKHLASWVDDPRKWNSELVLSMSDELLKKLLLVGVCSFLVGMVSKKKAMQVFKHYEKWWKADNNTWGGTYIENEILDELLHRTDLNLGERLQVAKSYYMYNPAPDMLAVMYGHLGFETQEIIEILSHLGAKESSNASTVRFRTTVNSLRKELKEVEHEVQSLRQ